MISVESLTKRFADAEAVKAISFRVEKGEILGFLGPNGAGKTTTMRMLTCFVPPTSGTAKVAGFDIYEQPVEVRRCVGYLPESVPLYGEMRVEEFLRFRARLKGVRRSAVGRRLDYVTGRCGLGDVRTRIIDHLSKGYRQRVGLAESLLHEPPILILDEPTVGLDPNQIRQVRELIRDLGREHTIILSSHILPEVEQVCGRVAIISRGTIVAQDRPEALREAIGGKTRLDVEIKGERAAVLSALESLPGVTAVRPPEQAPGGSRTPAADASAARAADAGAEGPSWREGGESVRLLLESEPSRDLREDVFRLAVERGWVLLGLARRGLSLEEIFVDLTTRESGLDLAQTGGAGGPSRDADGSDRREAPPDAGREHRDASRSGDGAGGGGGAR